MSKSEKVKSEKIAMILGIAAGNPYVIRKARPEMNFTLVDRNTQLFRCDETEEEISWMEIQKKYIADVSKFWGFCGICDSAEEGDLYFDSIMLFPVDKNEIYPVTAQLKFYDDISINVEDYHNHADDIKRS